MFNSKVQYISKLGSGGYGAVHEALVSGYGTLAVKQLTDESSEGVERFRREVRILTSLQHANIVEVIVSQLDEAPYWFAMPLADQSLSDAMDYLYLDHETVDSYFRQILDGISYAHAQQVIHRDLKPQNILVFGNSLRISDFGLGKKLDGSQLYNSYTSTGVQGGTEYYAAPEQFDDFKRASMKSDIFALGKTLYQMLTNRGPRLPVDLDKVPDKYRYIIDRCIEPSPENRFSTASELKEMFVTASEDTHFANANSSFEQLEDLIAKPVTAEVGNQIYRIMIQYTESVLLYQTFFPKLMQHWNGYFFVDRPEKLKALLEVYDYHVSGHLDFEYCDVVANTYLKICKGSSDLQCFKITFTRLLLMGEHHNRFHVMKTFCRVLCDITESERSRALIAKEVIENHPTEFIRSCSDSQPLHQAALPRILRQAVNKILGDE